MKFVPFGFSKLHHDREAHYDCARQSNGLWDKFNGAKFDITDTINVVRTANKGQIESECDEDAYPFERLDNLSVTMRESLTVPSPNLSSKKYPKSRAVRRAASWETNTDRASESSSSTIGSSPESGGGSYCGDGRRLR